LRARIVDQYIKSVMNPEVGDKIFKGVGKPFKYEDWVKVIE